MTVCAVCGTDDWWERPPEHGGGLVCMRCHPDPRTRGAVPFAPRPLVGLRGKLFNWAGTHAYPEVRFQPWAVLVGDETHWKGFCRHASAAEVDDVLIALGLEDLHDVESEVPDSVPQREV